MGEPETRLYRTPTWRREPGRLRERRERGGEEAKSELSFIIRKRLHCGEGALQGFHEARCSLQPEGLARRGQGPAAAVAWPVLEDKGRVWAATGQARISRLS